MGAAPRHPAGAYSATGKPSYQQDRHAILRTTNASVFAVADGHGDAQNGHLVAEHICRQLPSVVRAALSPTSPPSSSSSYSSSSSATDTRPSALAPDAGERLRAAVARLDASCVALTAARRVYAGSTLCAVVHTSGSELVTANVGDSRAIVVSSRGARAVTTDHVATHAGERERIERNGGWVVGGLVNGYISMSRALGDDDLKAHRNLTPFARPGGGGVARRHRFGAELFTGEADVGRARVGRDDLVVVVGSDGVWGRVGNDEVGRVVRKELLRGKTADEAARAVVKRALAKGSRDNVTAVVGLLHAEEVVVQRLREAVEADGGAAGAGDGGGNAGGWGRKARRRREVSGLTGLGVKDRPSESGDSGETGGTEWSPKEVRKLGFGRSGRRERRGKSLFM